MLPSSAIGFGISLRGKNSRQPIALTCADSSAVSSAATVGASPGAVAGTEAESSAQNGTGFASPHASLNGYWLTGGVFELQYSCSGAGGYLLHTWFRDAAGQVSTSPRGRRGERLHAGQVSTSPSARLDLPCMQALTTAPGPPRMHALTTAPPPPHRCMSCPARLTCSR